uniref:Bestrophin homolog n=1 Tax=Ascaris lumbricoides TaxID=6252 RepID=A0A0M3IPV5_ASCLU
MKYLGSTLQVRNLFNLSQYRDDLYYAFGLLCLGSWFIFNLWILRDYFFPWWFPPIYTDGGLKKEKLELKKIELIRKARLSSAFTITTSIAIPPEAQDSFYTPPMLNEMIF